MDEINPTLVDILRRRAIEEPSRIAYTFLADGETESDSITYEQLDRQVRAVGAHLQSLGMYGERALLLYPPGLDFIIGFFGCLYAGVIAVPAYSPDPVRPLRILRRLTAIVNDTKAAAALTTSAALTFLKNVFVETNGLQTLTWIATDTIQADSAGTREDPHIDGKKLAFLQYTSGSTTSPRGVMVSHDNIVHNASYYKYGWQHTEDTISVTWMPTFHDLGLMDGVIQPMYAGFRSVIMPPVAFLQRPFRWVKAISNYQASYSAGPNFAYDLCVRKTTPEQRASLNLSSWQSALNAAEPIRCETLERFAAAFEPAGFRYEYFKPGYGLAEATLKVACLEKGKTPLVCAFESDALAMNRIIAVSRAEERAKFEREDYHNVMKLVGCGTTMSDLFEVHVVIANPETMTRCAPNEVGEIWVSGPSITGGYWNRPDETDQTFNAYLRDTVEAPFLRTGDLGFIYMGELFVTGRLKDLIIIDGLNHYPQDIEYTIDSCHSAIRPGCSAAFSLDVDAQERVVIVTEVKPEYLAQVDPSRSKLSRQEIIKAIRSAVADEHGLQIHSVALIKAGTIPKTSSGKIQRYACRAQFLDGTLELCD